MTEDSRIQDLKKNLEILADGETSRSAADLFASAQANVLKPTPVRRRALAAAAAAILLIGGVVTFAFSRDDGIDVQVDPATPPPTSEPARFFPDREWTELADTPENVSNLITVTPTGVLAWNLDPDAPITDSSSPLDLTASFYDFASKTWAQIAAPQGIEPLSVFEAGQSATQWTGSKVVLFTTELSIGEPGSSADDTMALRTVSWEPGADSVEFGASQEPHQKYNVPFQSVRTTAQGNDVLVLVTQIGRLRAIHQLWRYEVGSDSFEQLADPPETSDRIYGFDWTGTEILLTSAIGPPSESPTDFRFYGGVEVLVLDPRVGPWETAAPAPDELTGQSAGAVWDGTRLVVISYRPSSAFYDPETNAWTLGADPPIEGCENYPAAISTDDGVVLTGYCDRFAETSSRQAKWRPLPGESVWPITSTGDLVAGLDTGEGPPSILVMPLSAEGSINGLSESAAPQEAPAETPELNQSEVDTTRIEMVRQFVESAAFQQEAMLDSLISNDGLSVGGIGIYADGPSEIKLFSKAEIVNGRLWVEPTDWSSSIDPLGTDFECGEDCQKSLLDFMQLPDPSEVTSYDVDGAAHTDGPEEKNWQYRNGPVEDLIGFPHVSVVIDADPTYVSNWQKIHFFFTNDEADPKITAIYVWGWTP